MEILATETFTTMSDGWIIIMAFAVVFGLFGGGIAVAGFLDLEYGVAAFGLCLLLIGAIVAWSIHVNQSYEYERHIVSVTDINEVYRQGYEIIENEGTLFKVEKIGVHNR